MKKNLLAFVTAVIGAAIVIVGVELWPTPEAGAVKVVPSKFDKGLSVGYRGTKVSQIRIGTATLVAGTVTVADTLITAGSQVYVGKVTPSGTQGAPYCSAKTAGTNFIITSTNAGDTSIVSYWIVDP